MQKSSTATSADVRTKLSVAVLLLCPPAFKARRWTCLFFKDFPREYFSSRIWLPTTRFDGPPLYNPVVLHHVFTEGWRGDLWLRESKKSTSTDRWIEVNFPYHRRLTVMFPLRSWPLWYLRITGGWFTRASMRDVAMEGWGREESMRNEKRIMVKW